MAPSRRNEKNDNLTAAATALNNASSRSGRVDIEQLHKTVAISESNGEISCSVEDTNKLRAALGLKPLRLTNDKEAGETKTAEEIAVANFAQKKAKEDKEKELSEIQVRLERAKKKRLLKEKLSGPTLGDADSTIGGAAEWVKKSRENAAMREAKLQAEKQRKLLEAQEASYTSNDLAGIKVGHGLNEFAGDGIEVDSEGGVVLTLKDASVLETDDQGNLTGLNEGDDELVNVNLVEAQRTKHLKQVKARAKQPVYSGIDNMDEMDDPEAMARSAQAYRAGISTKKVLGHYDEIQEQNKQLVLGAQGQVEGDTTMNGDNETNDGESSNKETIAFQSLVVAKKVMSDYMTVEEMNAGKPKKMRKKKDKKKTGLRNKLKLDEEEGEEDFGSRKGKRSDEADLADEKEAKARAFESAKSAANSKIEQAIQRIDEMNEGGEDSKELNASLSRLKRLGTAGKSDNKEKNKKLVEAFAAQALESNLAARAAAEALKQQQEAALSTTTHGGGGLMQDEIEGQDAASALTVDDGKIVFTPTHEFSSRLNTTLSERAENKAKMPPPPPPPGRPPDSAFRSAVTEDDITVDEREDEETEDADEEDQGIHGDAQMAFMHRQPLAQSGMAATIGLLQSSGDLGQKREELMIGRAKDQRWSEYDDSNDRIRIEHRDKDGRLLTQKEAFRQISYIFHGHGPKLKKQEKRRKEMNELEKSSDNSGHNFGTAAALQKTLSATGAAYMPISGGAQLGRRAAGMSYVDDLSVGDKEKKKKRKTAN